ncbi:MAG TPA: hypothetical protein VLX68_01255 [Chitinivibrionales bacterium]|nr:hypothetical protein [Chitinivibrionales bacterium]
MNDFQKRAICLCILALICTSFGQSHWTLKKPVPASSNLFAVTYGKNCFVAVGQDSVSSGIIYTSTDASTWTQTLKTATLFDGVAYGSNCFTVVGAGGVIYSSSDGLTWTQQASGITENLSAVDFCNGRFVAVGGTDTGLCTILSSADGSAWTMKVLQAIDWLYGITFGGGLYVAVGNDVQSGEGIIYTSHDDSIWFGQSIPVTNRLLTPAYGSNAYVVVGTGSTFTSPDGSTWTKLASGTSTPLRGLTFADSLFVAAGYFGTIITSPDGQTWTQHSTGTYQMLRSVTFGDTMFVAVGDSGTVLTSSSDATGTMRHDLLRTENSELTIRIVNSGVIAEFPVARFCGIVKMEVLDIQGRLVYQSLFEAKKEQVRIPVRKLPEGAYLLSVTGKTGRLTGRFILTK